MSNTLQITKVEAIKREKDRHNLDQDNLVESVFSRNSISVKYIGKNSGLLKFLDLDPYFFMYVSGNNVETSFELKFK